MPEATPDPATEELIWFAWPSPRPQPPAQVEADDKLAELVEPSDEREPPARPKGSIDR